MRQGQIFIKIQQNSVQRLCLDAAYNSVFKGPIVYLFLGLCFFLSWTQVEKPHIVDYPPKKTSWKQHVHCLQLPAISPD